MCWGKFFEHWYIVALFDTTHDSWLPVITAWGVFHHLANISTTKKLLMRTSTFQVSSASNYVQNMLNKMWHEPSWKHIRKHVLPKAKLCLICWDFLCTNVESFVQRMIYRLNHFLPESEQIDRISPCPHIPIKSTQLPWWPTWYLPKKNCT